MSEGVKAGLAAFGYLVTVMLFARMALHRDGRLDIADALMLGAVWPLVIAVCVVGGTLIALWRGVDYPFTRLEQYRQRRVAAEQEVDRWLKGS